MSYPRPGDEPNTPRGQSVMVIPTHYKPEKPTVERCSACGKRKRGPNHDDGPHHKGTNLKR